MAGTIPWEKLISLIDQVGLLTVGLICLFIGTGLTATVIAARASWPRAAKQMDVIVNRITALRRCLLGLINGVVLFIFMAVAFNLGIKLLGLLLLATLLAGIIAGLMAELAYLGRRVILMREDLANDFVATLTGGILLTTMFLLPFIGQMVFFYLAARSIGNTVYWLFKRRDL
jgi:hypothetical protein